MVQQGGCALRARRSVDPAELQLATCQARLLASERTQASLDAHLQCLLGVDVVSPEHPRVYAAIAHTLYVRGLAWPAADRDDLASARGWALRCLALQPGVAGRLRATGGRVTDAVVEAVPASDVDCLTWGAMAWARWIEQRGAAGMGIDLEAVRLLADQAATLSPEWDGHRPLWAVALSAGVVPPALGGDLGQTATAFSMARTGVPRAMLLVDEATLLAAPRADVDDWRQRLDEAAAIAVEGRDLDAYEDQAAVAIATQLRREEPPAPATW